MYRTDLGPRDRGGAVAAVVAIHVLLAFVLLGLPGKMPAITDQRPMAIFDISDVPPPPPKPPVVEQKLDKQKPKDTQGAASPENLRSQATPVTAPRPRIELPVPPRIAVSPTPMQGAQPTQGASDRPGPGTGAGGSGSGTGSGGSGSGTGGGGSGVGARPALITPKLGGRDYPPQVLGRWPRGGRVFVRFQVDVAGRPFNCNVDRSSGDPAVDQWTCSLVLSKLRFRPATDDRGRATVGWFGYVQEPRNF